MMVNFGPVYLAGIRFIRYPMRSFCDAMVALLVPTAAVGIAALAVAAVVAAAAVAVAR